MLINVASMTHSSRLGCGVRGWPVLGVLLILVGCAIFAGPPGTDSPGSEDPYAPFVAIFFWVCGAGCFAMLVRLYRLRRSWRAWVKEQDRKTDEAFEEEAKQWHRNPPPKKKKKKRRYKSKSKQVRQNIIVGAILAAAGQWWLKSVGVEDPWYYAPGVPLGIYILFVYNFTTME